MSTPMVLTALRQQLDSLATDRREARASAFDALHAIQCAIVEALGGARLRLHHLNTREAPYRGMQLRGKYADWKLDRREAEGECLVLRDDGVIAMACVRGGAVVDRGMRESDVRAEELPHVIERIAEALAYHQARVEASATSYRAVSSLAGRLSELRAVRPALPGTMPARPASSPQDERSDGAPPGTPRRGTDAA